MDDAHQKEKKHAGDDTVRTDRNDKNEQPKQKDKPPSPRLKRMAGKRTDEKCGKSENPDDKADELVVAA